MKIAILMGSPRKKDSYKICEQIKAALIQRTREEEVEFDYIILKQLHIEECRGCEQCLTKGEEFCPIKDECYQIKQRLIEADGIILVSPVYACQVSGTFKKVIDRLSYLFHRPELVAKPALTVLTTAGGGIKDTNRYLKLVVDGWACHLCGQLSVACTRYFENRWGCVERDTKYKARVDQQIEEITDKFFKEIQNRVSGKLPRPNWYDVFMFNALKTKTYTSQADYVYWKEKGWMKSHYYYETKLPLGSIVIEKVMDYIVQMMARKLGIE